VPVYTGSCTVACLSPLSVVQLPPDFTFPAILLTRVGLIMAVQVDPEGKTLAWGVSEQLAEKGRDGWREYEVSGEAARAAKKHYADTKMEPIRSLLDHVDETAVRLWAPYSIPDLPTWHLGRVCLVGDAAHALPPNGQGSAMAFEDIALLARLLSATTTNAPDYDKLFGHFERTRRRRIERVKKLSQAAGQVKATSPGPWAWYFKSWLIWAYFAVHRFVLRDTRLTSYDVMTEDIDIH
jgi:2-polyprenyl-6-methoxyphenol hydroxylase-like FAD-dependent oxidoreductase